MDSTIAEYLEKLVRKYGGAYDTGEYCPVCSTEIIYRYDPEADDTANFFCPHCKIEVPFLLRPEVWTWTAIDPAAARKEEDDDD